MHRPYSQQVVTLENNAADHSMLLLLQSIDCFGFLSNSLALNLFLTSKARPKLPFPILRLGDLQSFASEGKGSWSKPHIPDDRAYDVIRRAA